MAKIFLCLCTFLALLMCPHQAHSILPQPQELTSLLNLHNTPTQVENENARSCSYTVTIKTSCSSRSITRDKISLAFGDAYGNEVYVPRLDDPSTGTFERCSTDTFKINGACGYKTCYLYLLRTGRDGWKPEWVKINGPSSRAITFYYNSFLPNGVWYGFNLCQNNDTSLSSPM